MSNDDKVVIDLEDGRNLVLDGEVGLHEFGRGENGQIHGDL